MRLLQVIDYEDAASPHPVCLTFFFVSVARRTPESLAMMPAEQLTSTCEEIVVSLSRHGFIVREQDAQFIISVDTDGHRYADMQQEANRLCGWIRHERPKRVIIDLAEVPFLNSISIGIVVRLARESGSCGASVCLCNAAAEVLQVLETMNLTRLWPHYDSLETATGSDDSES